ncbi:MAG TPA: DNA polymerase III subunit gamma/tau, partial [Blastococcus sp.]|nr:DNA polymerase III subunit gamma/tau [Blastococcus sp.]
ALAAHDAPAVFRAVDRVVEAGHDPRRFATDLLDRLRDLIVLDAVPDAGGNGLLDCPPDRLDLMNQQASALGSATLSRMADTVHEGLTEMRGTTAPRLLLELVCARMLLPATDGSAAATLQRLERLERRMSIAGEHAGRPEAAVREAPREAPAREVPAREPAPRPAPAAVAPATPAAPAAAPAAPAPAAPAPAAPAPGSRKEYVRPSQRSEAPRPAAAAAPAAQAPAAADDWPETIQPGSGRGKPAAPAAPAPSAERTPARAAGEPDIPLPPEPTDDEEWPHAPSPTAARAAAARTEAAEHGTTPAAGPPRAAAESAPAPRGGEPTPVVSANPEPAADDGELTTTDVRRMWPELLAVVKRHKRTTEALLKNAQVHQLGNGVLTLSTSSPALARRLGDDLNKDVIREALNELLGVRWRVDAVVEGAAAASGQAVPPAQAQEAARAAEAAEAHELMAERAADVSGDREPEPVVDQEQAALSLLKAQLGAHPVDS